MARIAVAEAVKRNSGVDQRFLRKRKIHTSSTTKIWMKSSPRKSRLKDQVAKSSAILHRSKNKACFLQRFPSPPLLRRLLRSRQSLALLRAFPGQRLVKHQKPLKLPRHPARNGFSEQVIPFFKEEK